MKYKTFFDEHHLYFVTISISGWKPIFNEPKYAQIVLQSLKWLREQKTLKLFAFALMPDHLHIIMKPLGEFRPESIIQRFASYTSHEILKQLRQDGNKQLLGFFRKCAEEKKDRKHQIWQEALAKNVFSEKFLFEKMEYIHNNAVYKRWMLVENRSDYPYSSACYYDGGEEPIIPIDDVREYFISNGESGVDATS